MYESLNLEPVAVFRVFLLGGDLEALGNQFKKWTFNSLFKALLWVINIFGDR
ncbi:hypothetical protein N824_01605 [Pedobacter sp. V48]|nr:hypothetical protein N824_01605 [Pedobacter sp. V48]